MKKGQKKETVSDDQAKELKGFVEINFKKLINHIEADPKYQTMKPDMKSALLDIRSKPG